MSKRRTTSGRSKRNPQWLKEKYNVDIKQPKQPERSKPSEQPKQSKPEPRRKTLAVTDKYKRIRDSVGLKKGGEVGLDDPKKGRLAKWLKKFGTKGLKRQAKAEGGRIGYAGGTGSDDETQTYQDNVKFLIEEIGLSPEQAHMMASIERDKKTGKADGGIRSLNKGGKADKKWIQKATKGMRKDKPCTGKKFGSASCPPGSKRYNLAQTFKKMARSKHASGGLVRFI